MTICTVFPSLEKNLFRFVLTISKKKYSISLRVSKKEKKLWKIYQEIWHFFNNLKFLVPLIFAVISISILQIECQNHPWSFLSSSDDTNLHTNFRPAIQISCLNAYRKNFGTIQTTVMCFSHWWPEWKPMSIRRRGRGKWNERLSLMFRPQCDAFDCVWTARQSTNCEEFGRKKSLNFNWKTIQSIDGFAIEHTSCTHTHWHKGDKNGGIENIPNTG